MAGAGDVQPEPSGFGPMVLENGLRVGEAHTSGAEWALDHVDESTADPDGRGTCSS